MSTLYPTFPLVPDLISEGDTGSSVTSSSPSLVSLDTFPSIRAGFRSFAKPPGSPNGYYYQGFIGYLGFDVSAIPLAHDVVTARIKFTYSNSLLDGGSDTLHVYYKDFGGGELTTGDWLSRTAILALEEMSSETVTDLGAGSFHYTTWSQALAAKIREKRGVTDGLQLVVSTGRFLTATVPTLNTNAFDYISFGGPNYAPPFFFGGLPPCP